MRILEIQDESFHEIQYRSSGPKGTIRKCVLPFYKVKVDSLPKGVSSFVATSDLQGRENDKKLNRLLGEAVAEELTLLHEIEEVPKIDFAILAGDLFDYPDCRKLGGTGKVTRVWNYFASSFEKVVGVHGNHDIVEQEKLKDNISILDGSITTVHGLKIGGVSGIIGRTDRNQRKTNDEFLNALSKVAARKTDIIVLHQGPDDPLNDQKSEPLIREYFEGHGSSLVIFGHCHWSIPYIGIGKNQILNVDSRLYVFVE